MSERMSHQEFPGLPFGLDDPAAYINSENPPYNAYQQYLMSIDAAFTKAEVTDILDNPEIDQELNSMVDGFRIR